ncbi:MAG TPA: alpha/beta fold hydrolase [Streptosporangiaceae bacterium]|nr:alpha/beta fold hydrolase [Streptosporangiaceae bacterium]
MPYLDRAGIRIYYEVTEGPGGKTPLLLSHGYGASSAMWGPNVAALAAGRPVITWDMRGHGRSDSPEDPELYSHAACVADMAALLDAAGAERAVLGGLSLGGFVSLEFLLEHPDRVDAVMLFDTGPGYRSDQARQQWNDRARKTADRLERDGIAALGGSAEADYGHRSAHGLALAARGMLAQRDGRVIEALPSVKVPVLVLVGARDKAFLPAADYIAARIPGAVQVVIPDAGHVSNADQPGPFNRSVLGFLGRLPG